MDGSPSLGTRIPSNKWLKFHAIMWTAPQVESVEMILVDESNAGITGHWFESFG